MTAFYEVKVVNRLTGAVISTFDADLGNGDTRMKATVREVTKVLNEPGNATIVLPLFHPAAPQIQALIREVQVFRNGVLIHWGVPVQRTLEGQSVVWTCPGVLWRLTRLVFGPISVNYLTNSLFATNLTGWTAVGATATWSNAIRIRGPGTARLVATTSGDNYLQQTFTVNTGSIGLYLELAYWYWLDPAVAFVEPALDQRGLYIASTTQPGGLWEPVTMNAPIGQQQRIKTGIQLAPNLTGEVVTVRLYAPHGAIHWGAGQVTALESVSSEPTGTDITEMMRRIAYYAQNGTADYSVTGTGKAQLGILTPVQSASGVKETLAYQYKDLGNIFAALQTYPARGLADFDVVCTATTKTFTTYAPRKGSLKSYTFTVPGTSVNLSGFNLDGQQTVSKTIRRGAGDGPSREIGVAFDASLVDGLVFEDVSDAPPEVPIDGLNDLATTDLARLKDIVTIADIEVSAEGFIGVVDTGDTCPVSIDWGAVQDATTRRVVGWSLNGETDRVKVTVNKP